MNEMIRGEPAAPTPEEPQRTRKPWGYEELLLHGPYALKRLHVDGGQRLSLQYHERKIETLMVTSGTVEISLDGIVRRCGAGDVVHVPAGVLHRITAVDGAVDMMEASTPELDDLVRVEDDYGRVNLV